MITKPLFRRHFFVFAGVAVFFILLAFVGSFLIMSFGREKMMMGRGPHQMTMALLKASGGDPVATLQKMREQKAERPDLALDLIGVDGKSFVTGEQVLTEGLSAEQLQELEANPNLMISQKLLSGPDLLLSKYDDGRFLTVNFSGRGPPPPPPGAFREGERPPPPPPGGRGMIGSPLDSRGPFWQNPFWVTLASLVVCVIASVGISLMIFFSNYKQKAETALHVLQDLKSGNLAARMPQGKLDEVAPLVLAFNHMADEVQRLVENLRRSDQSRRQMLQDLAHDLRTPLASLKTFLETMVSDGERLTPARRQEIMRLCLSEVDYFSNLVEDLLFLAQITEPKYAKTVETINVQEELNSQMHVFRERHPTLTFEIHVPPGAALLGSQRLVTRMFRNALSNACSFAKTHVRIQVSESDNELRVVFLDDGPGFSEKALQEFGHKKASREISGGANQKRISVGIGSLIMCEIAGLHGGSAVAENRLENGRVIGAQVTFRLAKS